MLLLNALDWYLPLWRVGGRDGSFGFSITDHIIITTIQDCGLAFQHHQLPDGDPGWWLLLPPVLWICSNSLVSYWSLSFKSFSYASSLFSLREILSSACLTLSVKSVKFICVCPVVIFIERKSETLHREEAREACRVAQLWSSFSWHLCHPEQCLPARKVDLQVILPRVLWSFALV